MSILLNSHFTNLFPLQLLCNRGPSLTYSKTTARGYSQKMPPWLTYSCACVWCLCVHLCVCAGYCASWMPLDLHAAVHAHN